MVRPSSLATPECNTALSLLKGSLSSSDGEATPSTLHPENAVDSDRVGLRCSPHHLSSGLVAWWNVGRGTVPQVVSANQPRLEVGVGWLATLVAFEVTLIGGALWEVWLLR
jgi:hypothetical protein